MAMPNDKSVVLYSVGIIVLSSRAEPSFCIQMNTSSITIRILLRKEKPVSTHHFDQNYSPALLFIETWRVKRSLKVLKGLVMLVWILFAKRLVKVVTCEFL